MSSQPAQAHEDLRERSRDRILAAALQIFVEKGYHDATFSDITARAGVSRDLVTFYFPGKYAIVEELLERHLDGVTELLPATGTPDERLATIIDGVLLTTVRTLPLQRLALSLMIHPSTHPLFVQVEAMKQERVRVLEDGLREIFAARGAADPALEEVMFRSVLEGVIYKACVYQEQYPMERARRWLHEMYGLPVPKPGLIDDDPPPIDRMRAADPGA